MIPLLSVRMMGIYTKYICYCVGIEDGNYEHSRQGGVAAERFTLYDGSSLAE